MMTISRVRSYEGQGLTIRIPRHYSERGIPDSSQQPLMSPTHPHVILSSLENSRVVSKSKSLTTNIDKLSLSQKAPSSGSSSRESSFTGSRGSTPPNHRSACISRPISRRSTPSKDDSKPPRTPERLTPEKDDRTVKSCSPTGSEVSLNSVSVHSSSPSINSTKSSNASIKSRTSNRSCPIGESSSARCSPRAASEPPSGATAGKRMLSRELSKKTSSHSGLTNSSKPLSTPKKSSSSSSLPKSPLQDKKRSESATPAKGPSRRSTPSRSTSARSSTSSLPHTVVSGGQRKSLPVFNSYMSLFQVQEKLKKGQVIEGVLRIDPKSYEDALISAPVLLGRGDGHLYWRGT